MVNPACTEAEMFFGVAPRIGLHCECYNGWPLYNHIGLDQNADDEVDTV